MSQYGLKDKKRRKVMREHIESSNTEIRTVEKASKSAIEITEKSSPSVLKTAEVAGKVRSVKEEIYEGMLPEILPTIQPTLIRARTVMLRVARKVPPHIKTAYEPCIRIKVISTKIELPDKILPTMRVFLLSDSIKIDVLGSLPINLYETLPPGLKLEPTHDISVRPLISAEPTSLKEKSPITPKFRISAIISLLKSILIPTQRAYTTTSVVPKLKLTILSRTEMERHRIIDKKRIKPEGDDETLFKEISTFIDKYVIRGLGTASRISPDRPICVIVPKPSHGSYIYSVALICREIYRIITKRGKPNPIWLSEGSKEEIERELRAGHRIFVVDDSRCRLLCSLSKDNKVITIEDFERQLDEEKFFDRLRELFSQYYGFVLFHVDEKWAKKLAYLLRERAGYLIPKIIEVSSLGVHEDVMHKIAEICWGFVKTKPGRHFDEIFGYAEKDYYEALEFARRDVEITHYINYDPDASFEHQAVKTIVVKAVAKELGAKNKSDIIKMLMEGSIVTEQNLDCGRADIYVVPKREAIEIEMLYGRGDPIDYIDKKTLRKYLDVDVPVNRVRVVLLGLHALLYAEELMRLKKIYRDEHGLNVDFCVVDVRKERLISLRGVLRTLKGLKDRYLREGMQEEEVKDVLRRRLGREVSDDEAIGLYLEECEKHKWSIPSWSLRHVDYENSLRRC